MKSEDIDKMIWKQSKNGFFFFVKSLFFFLELGRLIPFPLDLTLVVCG